MTSCLIVAWRRGNQHRPSPRPTLGVEFGLEPTVIFLVISVIPISTKAFNLSYIYEPHVSKFNTSPAAFV